MSVSPLKVLERSGKLEKGNQKGTNLFGSASQFEGTPKKTGLTSAVVLPRAIEMPTWVRVCAIVRVSAF